MGEGRLAVAICPNCGEDNPDKAKFCSECATPLKDAPPSHAEERKVVSVLFVDLVGFTARSHDADPEDVRAALQPYHRLLKTEIERFGGTVEKFIGDAVMAVFGAPVAHEDDAERAVRSALRITEAIEELNGSTPNLDLSIRAAVNTGEGLVTLGARPQAGEGMVTGDVVNTASRLQGIAPVGGVAVGEITYRSTKDFISYEPLEAVTVKGKPEPIPVWKAVSARSRFGVDVDMAPKTPFIGRDFDLGALKNSYQRTLREASVQLVTITGEPGVGKTRLLSEFSSFIDDQDEIVYWRQGRSLPYGEGITFWALGEIIKAQAGILESDSPETASDKLQLAVEAVVEERHERAWFVARLGPLVGAKASQSGSAEKEESFTAWRRFLEAIASRSPLMVVFEDLHWADATMLEFIDHLVEWSTSVPLFVVCTARPELYERHQGWGGGKRNSTTIALSSLSDSETAQLISALLSQAVLPAEVHSALMERAGGNPLYAEEFIRMLSDQGILQRKGRVLTLNPDTDIPMPDNVQALIAARLDTLSAERKALLHDASVAGKVFWSGVVAALGQRDDRDVREGLHELARKELVRPARNSSMEGQQEYSFWHALVRDVAYGQIPRAARGEKHRAMAEWIETIAGERVGDHAEVLAHHYGTALSLAGATEAYGDVAELQGLTRRFLLLGGDRALPMDPRKAETCYREALAITPLSDTLDRASVVSKLAEAVLSVGGFTESRQLYEEAIAGFESNGDDRAAGRCLVSLTYVMWHEGMRSSDIDRTAQEAVARLEPHGPSVELARAYSTLGGYKVIVDSVPEAMTWLEKALQVATGLGASEVLVEAMGFHGMGRVLSGDLGGVREMEQAISLGLEKGLGRQTAISYTNLGGCFIDVDGPARALDVLGAGMSFARQHGLAEFEPLIQSNEINCLFALGRWDEALTKAEGVLTTCEAQGAVQEEQFIIGTIVLIHALQGRGGQALALVPSLLEHARVIGDPQTLLPSLTSAAVAFQASGEIEKALVLVEEFEASSRDHPDYRAECAPNCVRICSLVRATALAERLVTGLAPTRRVVTHSLVTANAILAESVTDAQRAMKLYSEAAARWAEYGFVLEEGQAHFGVARCLIALGDSEAATEPLQKARVIFSKLGARPLIDEVDRHLVQGTAQGA